MSSFRKPVILWSNLMLDGQYSTLARQFSKFCLIRFPRHDSKIPEHIERGIPDIICFEYDYPDHESLQLMLDVQKLYPSIPIIMFTLQHSESLAVWALRNRLFDFHCKPLNAHRITDLSRSWVELFCSGKKIDRDFGPIHRQTTFPDDVHFRSSGQRDRHIDTAVNYVLSHYSHSITETELAEMVGMSRFQFSRLFKKITGKTFKEFLSDHRILSAVALLKNPNANISEVSYAVGFSDPSYFSRVFKRLTGHMPSEYRNGENHEGVPPVRVERRVERNLGASLIDRGSY